LLEINGRPANQSAVIKFTIASQSINVGAQHHSEERGGGARSQKISVSYQSAVSLQQPRSGARGRCTDLLLITRHKHLHTLNAALIAAIVAAPAIRANYANYLLQANYS